MAEIPQNIKTAPSLKQIELDLYKKTVPSNTQGLTDLINKSGGAGQAVNEAYKAADFTKTKLTPKQQVLYASQGKKTNRGQIFDGGFFSSLLDVLSLPQYAVTGLFDPNVSIGDAVKYRYTPSEALKLDGVGGFMADVALDPLNFIGLGAATKLGKVAEATGKGLKAVEEAGTLAGAVKSGQKSLLSIKAPFVGDIPVSSLFGKTGKALEEKTAEWVTRGVQNLKRVGVGDSTIGDIFSGAFGTLKSLPAGIKNIDEIESLIKGTKQQRNFTKALLRIGRISDAKAIDSVLPFVTAVKKAKLSKADSAALQRKLFAFESGVKRDIKLSKQAQEIFDSAAPLMRASGVAAKRAGIAGKQAEKFLPLIPTEEALNKGWIKPAQAPRILGQQERSQKFQGVFKLGNDVVQSTGKGTAESVKTGKVYKEVFEEESRRLSKAEREGLAEIGRLKDKTEVPKDIAGLWRDKSGKTLLRRAVDPFEANKAFGKKVYKEDAFESLFHKLASTGKINARKTAIMEAATKFGRPIKEGVDLPEGYVRIKGIEGLENFAFEKETAEAIETSFKPFTNLDSVKQFVKAYDVMQNTWKKIVTSVNPAFHTRNAVSNHWQMWNAGLTDPRDHLRGYALVSKAKRLTGHDKKIWDEFVNEGLGGTGQFMGDYEAVLKKESAFFKPGSAAGNFVEDSAKMGLYASLRKKGWSQAKAAERVRKFLFDYGDLTPLEKNVFKRVAPFYTWMRKNVPLQIAMLIQKPTHFTALAKAQRAIENMSSGEPIDERLMPDWMKNGYNIWLGQSDDGRQNFLKLEGFIPAVDISKIVSGGDVFMSNLSPLIKTPVELFTNYNMYYKEQITEYPGQTTQYFGQEIPTELQHVLRNLRPLNELESVMGMTKKEKSVPERLAKLGFGSVYQSLDPASLASGQKWAGTQEIIKINKDLKAAEKKGDTKTVERLQKIIADIEARNLELSAQIPTKEDKAGKVSPQQTLSTLLGKQA
jgi:hypothetical protein